LFQGYDYRRVIFELESAQRQFLQQSLIYCVRFIPYT
jgi:hypothetical protein